MRVMTTVSYEGDDVEKAAIRIVAQREGVEMGALVKTAVNKVYGKQIAAAKAAVIAARAAQDSVLSRLDKN